VIDDETFEDDEKRPIRSAETSLAAHHELILSATQRCIERPSGRTMLFLPPGSAKSTYATVVAPTWVMGVKPGFKVICASYGSDLSRKFGRRTRSIIKQEGYKSLFDTSLSAESAAVDEWALENGSEYMAGGLLSGMTGNRADFIPIDDPTKGRREAGSEATQKSTMEAYQDDLLTRLKPYGSLMLTQTRWDMNDLAGQILPETYNGESGMIECRDGNTWEVICVPAKCERADDPLGRKIGDYIWPEWFPRDHWKPFERIPRTWSALYQQRPAPESGDYFKRDWINLVDKLPDMRNMYVYGASDYAVTKDGGDYTVHIVIGLDPDGRLYLLDLWRAQSSSDIWVESFIDLVLKWSPIGWAEEAGQIKSGIGPFMRKRMIERKAHVYHELFPTRGDKSIRAQSIRGRIALNGLYILKDAPFLADLITEMMSFPVGVHDDQVDALGLVGQLLDLMTEGPETKPDKPDQPLFKPLNELTFDEFFEQNDSPSKRERI
jgi:predicted phage terminase large subunit-like protein